MNTLRDFFREIRPAVCTFLGIVAAAAVFSVLFWVEVAKLHHSIGEDSIVEVSQLLMLVASGVLLLVRAKKHSEWRGALVLVGGFFLCAGIREMDAFFDVWLWHGAWAPIAIAAALVCCYVAWRAKDSVLPGLVAVANDRNIVLLCVGLAILLVFSRVFGHKAIWRALGALQNIDPSATGVFKSFGEETTEALGDLLIFLWAIFFKGARK